MARFAPSGTNRTTVGLKHFGAGHVAERGDVY